MVKVKLLGTEVEKKYLGCGDGFLKRDLNGKPSDLIYRETTKRELTDQEALDLLNDGYEYGECSCYEFLILNQFERELSIEVTQDMERRYVEA